MNARSMLTIFGLAIPVLVGGQQNSTPDVVSRLLPNPDNPREVVTVTPSERADVIKQLRTAQTQANGDQLRKTAFLLALLNSDYQRNRNYLIHELRACTTKTIRYRCDENTAAFLIGLFERGHGDVLQPLMLHGTSSDGALAEMVGDFLATTLTKHPADFLNTLRRFPPTTQTKVCGFTGIADGGGMAPDDLQRVRRILKEQGDAVALRCLKAVERSNKPKQ